MNALAQELASLLQDWEVTVTGQLDAHDGKPWCVRLASRRTGRAHMTRGATADEAIHRAWAGEVDDNE